MGWLNAGWREGGGGAGGVGGELRGLHHVTPNGIYTDCVMHYPGTQRLKNIVKD